MSALPESGPKTLALIKQQPAQAPILAIDPGPTQSAWVVWDGERVLACGQGPNEEVLLVPGLRRDGWPSVYGCPGPTQLVVERPMFLGNVGGAAQLMETAYWAGRFAGNWGSQLGNHRIPYHRVRTYLAHNKAKESEVRAALLERLGITDGGKGTKAKPGPFYGVKEHMWSALAVAVAWWEGVR